MAWLALVHCCCCCCCCFIFVCFEIGSLYLTKPRWCQIQILTASVSWELELQEVILQKWVVLSSSFRHTLVCSWNRKHIRSSSRWDVHIQTGKSNYLLLLWGTLQKRFLKHGLKPMESPYKPASDYSRCTGPHCRTRAFSGWAFKYRNHVPSTRTVSQKAKLVHLGISPDLWPLMDKVFVSADALSVPTLIYSLNGASIVESYEGRGPATLWLLCCSQTAHISSPWSVTASFASLLLFLSQISASKHTGTLETEHRSSWSNGHSWSVLTSERLGLHMLFTSYWHLVQEYSKESRSRWQVFSRHSS